MPLLRNIGMLATCRAPGGQGEIHPIRDAALAWEHGRITWVGSEVDVPPILAAGETWDAAGRLVIPGLIDCHTHLVFGGNRAAEFEMRLNGASYAEVAHVMGLPVGTVMSRVYRASAALRRFLDGEASAAAPTLRRVI